MVLYRHDGSSISRGALPSLPVRRRFLWVSPYVFLFCCVLSLWPIVINRQAEEVRGATKLRGSEKEQKQERENYREEEKLFYLTQENIHNVTAGGPNEPVLRLSLPDRCSCWNSPWEKMRLGERRRERMSLHIGNKSDVNLFGALEGGLRTRIRRVDDWGIAPLIFICWTINLRNLIIFGNHLLDLAS